MTALLEARGVGRRARREPEGDEERWLLRGVSLAIEPGERVALVGPTGAGKTLFLRALALLDPLDEGEIRWLERPIADQSVPAFRRQAIYLHQRPALIEGTVLANLRRPFELAIAETPYDAGRVKEILSALGRMESFLARATSDLSGGEAQIVAFLRAIQLEPRMLLLDEATAALDPESAMAIEKLVNVWHADRPAERALVWVTHDAVQAGRLTNRSLRLSEGRMSA